MTGSAPSATAKDLIGGEPGIGIFASRLYDLATGTVSAAPKAQAAAKSADRDNVKSAGLCRA
ncbi:MAG: hypothetical protein ACLPPF_15635 [Rhodomicrobium sp.]